MSLNKTKEEEETDKRILMERGLRRQEGSYRKT
jgi:hypothetical protein